MSLGILLFGMTPFGWRFMGTLFGVGMLPLLYVFLKNLFGRTSIAACGTILLAADLHAPDRDPAGHHRPPTRFSSSC